jgi:ADP-ribose pyrophosphatase YjhB (NUDIX family)
MKKPKTYCVHCGSKITRKNLEGKQRDYCQQCNTIFYENPLPVASSIVVNENRQVLLVKRKKDPYRDMWCLPIGFAEVDEEVHSAALRELREEAGVEGEIVRLIDVDTVDNYFYGSLAIVTYEVRMTGGVVRPGDDASDAGFFKIDEIPKLAWSSNEKAIRIYIDNYRDIWAVVDSYRQLFPEIEGIKDLPSDSGENRSFLSNVLIKIIDKHIDDISQRWIDDVIKKLPNLRQHLDDLTILNKSILRGIQYWLKRQKDMLGVEEFIDLGKRFQKSDIALADLVTVLALSRKSLWLFILQEKIVASFREIYTSLELNNRIIFFYDKIIYNIIIAYSSK